MSKADVLVIGGGLVGCATAYHLAKAGADVVVVEQGALNGKASGQNAGSLHFQLEQRLVEQGDRLADHFAATIPLNRMAIAEWAGLESELEARLEVVMEGGLMVAETDAERALLEKKHRLEEQNGLNVRLIDGTEARALAPGLSQRVAAAAYCADEGHANPRLVTLAFANAAAKRGVRFRTQTRLSALARRGGGYTAQLCDGEGGQGSIRADRVLNAAGAWAGEAAALSDLHVPVFPLGLTRNVTERSPPLLGHLIQHIGRKLSMKQVSDGNILVGGGWPSRLARPGAGGAGFDLTRRAELLPGSVRRNLAVACDIVPALRRLHLLRSWTGIVAATPDELPLLGEVASLPGYFIAVGGAGFTLGPTFGRLMSALILTGAANPILTAYSPARFGHLNRTLD